MLVHRGVSNICVYYVHVSLDRTLCSLVVRFSRSRDMFARGSVAESDFDCIIYSVTHGALASGRRPPAPVQQPIH